MEDDRVAILEAQLSQAKLIAEESDKKYEEVNACQWRPTRMRNRQSKLFQIVTFHYGVYVTSHKYSTLNRRWNAKL